jgi:hypothetical protein
MKDLPSKENHISKIPALQMLVYLGCMNSINQFMDNKVVGFIVQKLTI